MQNTYNSAGHMVRVLIITTLRSNSTAGASSPSSHGRDEASEARKPK